MATVVNEATVEVRFIVTIMARVLLAVRFRLVVIKHAFRVAKPDTGLTHYMGWDDYTGLGQHLTLSLIDPGS